MDAFLNNEDISKLESATQWDESLWSQGKEGVGVGENNDQYLRPLGSSAAATRPNSPAPSTRSNLHPSSKQEEDDDMARAIAMSQGDAGGAFQGQQESGVVGPSGGPVFGPANRDSYEKGKWEMVRVAPVANEASEIIPDAPVGDSIHMGEPRMLKPLPGGDYTPNLLTICAAIDGAREMLLMREHVQENYGQDAEWWRGHPISMPKIVHVHDGSPAEPEADDQDEILAEVQRLMAFMSKSDRAYMSAQALTQTNVIKKSSPATTSSRTLLELFLQSWAVAAASKSKDADGVTSLFNTTVGTNAPQGMNTPDMSLIDVQVAIGYDASCDLFELLDGLLWETDANGSAMSDNYIERPAEVLVVRAYQANPTLDTQLRVEAPAEFYVDKYLKENIEATRATRMEMAKGKQRIAKIEQIEKRLKTWKHPKKHNVYLDSGELLKHTLGHFSGQNRIELAQADKTNTAAIEEDAPAEPPHYAEITQKLEKVIASIENKLTVLAEEKEKTRKAISEMSKAPPPGLRTEDLKHRYTLRGVATKPGITYVLSPVEGNPEDEMEMFDDATTPSGLRWWRMEYDVNASGLEAKLTKTKAGDYDVLRAVELEHHSALLVYASDNICAPLSEVQEPPDGLKEFIRKDNESFAAEIQAGRDNQPPAYNIMDDVADIPRASIERSSMDSTRVEGAGGSDDGSDAGHDLWVDGRGWVDPAEYEAEGGYGADGAFDDVPRGYDRYGDPSPPAYEDDTFMGHPDFGLGPDIKQGGYEPSFQQEMEDADGPVHEIKLDDNDLEAEFGEGEGVEMVEKVHQPLLAGGSDAVTGEAEGGDGRGRLFGEKAEDW